MHVIILGMTESGKTNAAKLLIKQFKNRGIKSILLDPLNDPAFNADFQTDNVELFESTVFNSRNCLVIVDESSEQGKYNSTIRKCATKGRHWGHTCLFLAQKATQIDPLIRDQCGAIFLFCSGAKSGAMLAEEFNCDELKNCTELKQGEYFYKTRFDSLVKGCIFTDLKNHGLYDPSKGAKRAIAKGMPKNKVA